MSERAIPPATAPARVPEDLVEAADVEPTPAPGVPPEGLRVRTAKGVLINSGFRIGLAGLGLVRNVAIAAFLTREEYGLWALILVTLIALAFLKQVGISDKYLQQRDLDQELAFQRAFTLGLAYSLIFYVVAAVLLPVYALIYGQPDMLLPAFVVSLALVASAFQAPVWIFYRRMQYMRQRSLEAIDPVVSSILMIGLAAAGLGYWALVIGALAGTVVAAVAAVLFSPYRLAWRFDRGALREYFGFSWPLLLNGAGALIVVQGTLIVGEAALGLAAVGAIGLAANFSRFSSQVEQLVNKTLYPAVCAAQDRIDTLYEVFVKSNRLGLMWAVPFGVGLSLFAGDLISFMLGERWRSAELLLQVGGLTFALHMFGFAWRSFYAARGNTRPIAITGLVWVVSFFLIVAPLMLTVGLNGYAIGWAAAIVAQLAVRSFFLRRLFAGFSMLRHLVRGLLPVVPGALLILAVRTLLESGPRSELTALVELVLFTAVALAFTVVIERRLIAEALGYLRRAVRPGAPAPVAGSPSASR